MSEIVHAPRTPQGWWKAGAQLALFAGGIGLLVWMVREMMRPENREVREKILHASPGDIAALAGLTVLSLYLNGWVFWLTIRPVQRLNITDLQATNAVATTLAGLPFKLSIVFRAFIHSRLDRVPLVRIVAWLIAVTVCLGAATVPVFFTSLARSEMDGLWFAGVVGGLVGMHGLVWGLSAVLAGERGLERLRRGARAVLPGRAKRFAGSKILERVHDGFTMLGSPKHLAATMAVRVADMLVLAMRLHMCAEIAGVSVTFNESIIFSAVRFGIATFLPSGAIGSQEAGTAWFAQYLRVGAAGRLQTVMVFMLVVEQSVYVMTTVLGLIRLRPGRLVNRAPARAHHEHPHPHPHPHHHPAPPPEARRYDPPDAAGAGADQPDGR